MVLARSGERGNCLKVVTILIKGLWPRPVEVYHLEQVWPGLDPIQRQQQAEMLRVTVRATQLNNLLKLAEEIEERSLATTSRSRIMALINEYQFDEWEEPCPGYPCEHYASLVYDPAESL